MHIACIPAYNEERTIYDVTKRCLNYVDKVIVCDDGSTDNTIKKAKDAGAIVINHEKNLGKGTALKSLFDYAKTIDTEIMITIDGDGQFLPEQIEILMKPIIEQKADVVIGYRFNDNTEMPKYRKFGNKILDKITNIATDSPFRDTQSGFRAYSKKAIEVIKFTADGFGADSEILVDASKKDLQISQVPVTVIYDTGGKTSTKNPISHSGNVIVTLIELIALRYPLRYLGIPGFLLIIIGIISSTYVLSVFNETRYFSIPLTLMSLGFMVIGLILFMISIILFSITQTSKRSM